MTHLARAVEQTRANGLIYAIDRETGEPTPMTMAEYCALSLDALDRYRFTFNVEKAYGARKKS
jgi:hypothetical protein